jgi:hypothetical protein
MPNAFERATGVVEQTRQCMAKGCYRYFRSANEHDTDCPHCNSSNTRDIKADASGQHVAGDTGRMTAN